MPIKVDAELRRPSEEEFRKASYEVVGHAFQIHNEFGRFFDEAIYQRLLAERIPGSRIEVPLHVMFRGFSTDYYLDLVVDNAFLFELKTVQGVHQRHRGQLLNYLLLTDLPRGKLINFRPESLEHEFVNTSWKSTDRILFDVDSADWTEMDGVKETVVDLLRDWGTGLDIALYRSALNHLCCDRTDQPATANVIAGETPIGKQPFDLLNPHTAIKISTLPQNSLATFYDHLQRQLSHTNLAEFQSINITNRLVTFRTIRKRHSRRNTR